MVANLTGLGYFAPILAFLIVFIIVFAILNKTKLLHENAYLQVFFSLLIATIFVSAAGLRDFVMTITPWFAALVVALFFILLIVAFVGKPIEGLTKGIGVVFIILLSIIFLLSAFVIFSEVILSYIFGVGDAELLNFLASESFYNSRIFGAILLVVVSAGVSWVLVRKGK